MNSQIEIRFENQVQNFTEKRDIQLIQDYIEKKFSLSPESFSLGYNDDDGDFITISTQDDFNTFQEICQNNLKIEVIQNENNCQDEKICQQKESGQKEQTKQEIDNSEEKKKTMIQKIKAARKQVISKFQQKNINSKTFNEEQKAEMRKKRMEAMKKKQALVQQLQEEKIQKNLQNKQEFYQKAREDPHLSRVMIKLQSDIQKALPKLHDFLDEDFTYQKQQEQEQKKNEKQQFKEQLQQQGFSLFNYLDIDSIFARGVQIENILKTQKKPINEKKFNKSACKIQRFFMNIRENIIRKKQQKKQDHKQNQENQQNSQLIKKQEQKCDKFQEKKEEKKEEPTKKPQQNQEQQQLSFEKKQFSQEQKQYQDQDKDKNQDQDQSQLQSFFEVPSNLENNSFNLENQEQQQQKQQDKQQQYQEQEQEEQSEQDEKFELINQENKVNKQEKDENNYSIEIAQKMQELLGGVQIQYEQFLKNQQSGKTIEQLIDSYLSSLEF